MFKENDLVVASGTVSAFIFFVNVLTPQTGDIAGYPIYSIVGIFVFAVMALFLFFKHRA